MDVLDFILAINLLARTTYDKKLKLLFELCDDDDDGCMTPKDIMYMLQRVERVFAQECAKVDLDSTILNNFVADQKAENNFHIIMGMIKYQSLMKQGKLKMQQEKAKEGDQGSNSKNKKDKFNHNDIQANSSDNEDNLITYWEFINAIKALKNLHRKVLPRTLSFKDVLSITKTETEFNLSDTNVDDFAMFRYEINSIFKLH